MPAAKPLSTGETAVRITPAGFRIEGNSLFDGATLTALIADRINRPTDLAGLVEAAGQISRYYRAKGYMLTEAYSYCVIKYAIISIASILTGGFMDAAKEFNRYISHLSEGLGHADRHA
ncbi:MAG: POTRA domain-containing protein, partial [Polaromonas sp.]|nr:POTRA domain-containing protein [Polaromonas sp.]